jgi:hypothetical protein
MRWVALSATAAIAAAVIAVFVMAGPTMVATPPPPPTARDTGVTAPKPPSAQEQRGAELRDEAFGACEKAQWRTCLQKLDEAKALDPAGDANPRVRGWRGTAERRVE